MELTILSRHFIFHLFIWSMALAGEYDLTVEVPPRMFQCYFQTIMDRHKSFEVDYQVIDGGDLNVNFMLNFGASVLLQDSMKTDNSHRIQNPEPGEYQICFDNTFSYQTRKVVYFEVYLYDKDGNLEEEDITKYAFSDPELQNKLQQIGMTVTQFQAFEARDRSISMAQNDRVLFWSVVNTVVVLFVGGIQVYLIRSLFEENSRIGRALRK